MKYTIPLRRTKHKEVVIFADSPHQALKAVLMDNPSFESTDYIGELIEDPESPGEEIEGRGFEVAGSCEHCGKYILTGDSYYQWGGEDPVKTCEACGGADETHELETAE